MKSQRLTTLILLTLLLPGRAADVVINFGDFQLSTNDLAGASVNVIPTSTPSIANGKFVTSDRRKFACDGAASLTLSNIVYGSYTIQIEGPWTKTAFGIVVPDTNITLNATSIVSSATIVPGSTVAYTQVASDARYVPLTNAWFLFRTVSVEGSRDVALNDQVSFIETDSENITNRLPSAVGIAGKVFWFVDKHGQASVNPFRIKADGIETINGVNEIAISDDYASVAVISTGLAWRILTQVP